MIRVVCVYNTKMEVKCVSARALDLDGAVQHLHPNLATFRGECVSSDPSNFNSFLICAGTIFKSSKLARTSSWLNSKRSSMS